MVSLKNEEKVCVWPSGHTQTKLKNRRNKNGNSIRSKEDKRSTPGFYYVICFYKVFGKDAYILSELFDYNINIVNNNVATCGFPLKTISKVRSELEELKISYMLIDPRNNYDIDLKEDFRNLNTYQEQFEIAYKKAKNKKMINRIETELLNIIEQPYFKETIRKIEDILDEARKV